MRATSGAMAAIDAVLAESAPRSPHSEGGPNGGFLVTKIVTWDVQEAA